MRMELQGDGNGVLRRSSSSTLLIILLVGLLAGASCGWDSSSSSAGSARGTENRVLTSNGVHEYIRQACNATSYPEVCFESLTNDSRSRQGFTSTYSLVELAVEIASGASSESLRLSRGILRGAGSNKSLTAAARDCVQVLEFAMSRYKKCSSLFSGRSFSVKDLEAWLSSIENHQYNCFSALDNLNSTRQEIQSAAVQAQLGILLISNALSMAVALENYGLNVSKWQAVHSSSVLTSKPGTVESSAWEWIQGSKVESFNQLKASAVVGKDEAFKYTSIQRAIDDAPSNSSEIYVIRIMAGVYDERIFVPESKTKVMLVGEGIDKTIITGNSFSLKLLLMMVLEPVVAGDDFVARDLTIRNTAGPEHHQAVALRIDADRVIIQSCLLLGFQDTLYSHTLRHYFVDSTIAGTVDFIFGNSAAVFKGCKLLVRQGIPGVYTTTVTAHGRTDPVQTTGFVFHNCVVDSAPGYNPSSNDKTYLGRPWRLYSRTVYENCYLGSIVAPEGWLAWNGDFALHTLFYAEYDSYGPGGDDLTRRVPWSTQLNASQVLDYSVHSFIQGDCWIFGQ